MSSSLSDSDKLFVEIQHAAQRRIRPDCEAVHPVKKSIPNYLILEEIHRGGQGVVFKAIQESTKRVVALKFILQGSFATERQRYRFEREIDLASRLSHPNIVTIYDGGIANNQPFCAMEFVDGRRLNHFELDSTGSKSSIREVIGLFRKVCAAAGYAHSRGVVHRDLKPATILVDRTGEPHILDFGLAKVMEPAEAHSPHTLSGEFVGTLLYASPEQAQAHSELTDARSDVYSLGVVLYELLTGKMPYDVSGSIVETLTNITTAEPLRPSLSRSGMDLDIETILLKALSKDPDRRYQNASLLADDLRRYLDAEPIDARRDSNWYVLKKTVLRHRRMVIAATSFVGLLIVSLIAVSLFYLQAVHERDLATKSQIDEKKHRKIAVEQAVAANTARKQEVEHREEAEFRTYVAHIAASDSSIRNYDALDAVRNLGNAPINHRAFEWWYLLGQVDLSESSLGGTENAGQFGKLGNYMSVDYHPESKWLVSGGLGGFVLFWNPASKREIGQFDFARKVQCVRVHPNGQHVAVGFVDGDALLLNIETQSEDQVLVEIADLAFSTEGQQLHE